MIGLTEEENLELLELLELDQLIQKRNRIDTFFPDDGPLRRELYKKHLNFYNAGSEYKLRLLMAANRVGKTVAAVIEIVFHITGEYPNWWTGKRFQFSQNWWVCGVDSKVILGTLQPLFLGPVGDFGTGMIPYDCLDFDTLKDAQKADTGISMFRVKHSSGTMSSIEFKSYESGRESFQSFAGNIYLDEEPPLPIYSECLMRTMGDYIMLITFTPLKGPTDTILNFLEGATYHEGPVGVGKHVTMCDWDEVPHISENDKEVLLAATPPWLREARSRGIPQMGSGAIYQIPIKDIQVKRFEIPSHWKRYAGMDVGNKTAAIWFAISPDNGKHYAYNEYYREGQLPSVHAETISLPGNWIPIAIDHAAHGRSQIDGKNLFDMYEDLGLKLHNADKSVETGIYTVWELLSNGTLKVFDDLARFAEEYQKYRKDEKGNIVKKEDHILDAFRYAIMTGRDKAINKMEATPVRNPAMVSHNYRPQPVIRR
jgi:phage terminase large subunit-like protein